jgi:hypothetical protein
MRDKDSDRTGSFDARLDDKSSFPVRSIASALRLLGVRTVVLSGESPRPIEEGAWSEITDDKSGCKGLFDTLTAVSSLPANEANPDEGDILGYNVVSMDRGERLSVCT